MIHPLIRLLVTKPHLLSDHVEAYAQLVGEEVGKVSMMWVWRIVFGASAAVLGLIGIAYLGIALMLWGAADPSSEMRHPWLLFLVPLVPLAAAGFCVWRAQAKPDHDGFAVVKEQLNADMAMLREVSSA